jgi:biopolymer transport protein TolQ
MKSEERTHRRTDLLTFSLSPAELTLWDIIQNLRPVPLAVIAILVLFSLFSWTIVFSKSSVFSRARRDNRNFLRAFRKANNLQSVAVASEQFGSAPLVAVFDFGYGEIERQVKQRGALVNKDAIERSLQLGISEEVTKLELNMNWLATVASVSPFIGLFGTVWGIIDAFEGLGNAGSASLRAVAPGISEALVTTAIGLAAAIPAAIFYNVFGTRIREMGTRMEDFAIEFQNLAERDFGG